MITHDIERELLRHPLIMGEMGIQMQLGLPWLYRHREDLCLCYKPHREVYQDDTLWIYGAQYELCLVYPSRHIIRFVNLYYERGCRKAEPVCGINGQWMMKEGRQYLEKLYMECSRALQVWTDGDEGEERTGRETREGREEEKRASKEAAILQYQSLFKETAERLGLLTLYGEVRQDADCSI